MRIWLNNPDGKPDAVLTFSAVAFATVIFKLLFAGLALPASWKIGWTVQPIDATTIGAILLPTLGAYVSNKYVNLNYHPDYLKMKADIDGDGQAEDVFVEKKEVK